MAEFWRVGELIAELLNVLSRQRVTEHPLREHAVREEVKRLLARFPIYDGVNRVQSFELQGRVEPLRLLLAARW
jgi:hypothetical protein